MSIIQIFFDTEYFRTVLSVISVIFEKLTEMKDITWFGLKPKNKNEIAMSYNL